MGATLTGTGWLVDPIAAPLRSVPASTWAGLPSAASYQGVMVRVTDVGIAPGALFVSDGTRWIPAGHQCLARSAVAMPTGANTTENVLVTVSIPAGALGLSGALLVNSSWTMTNGANDKTTRVRLGGAAGMAFMAVVHTTVSNFSDSRRIRNRAVANSQVGNYSAANAGGFGGNANAGNLPTGTIDTAAETTLVITGQKASGTDLLQLDAFDVWLLP